MAQLRIALAQTDPTVGDFAGNARMARDWTRRAADAGAQLVAFPEMFLTGYPVEDLVFRESFVSGSRAGAWVFGGRFVPGPGGPLRRRAGAPGAAGLGAVAGVWGSLAAAGRGNLGGDAERGRGPRDALALLHGGQVVVRYFKHHLP